MAKSRAVTFVLPMHTVRPVGGFKIVYEYANRLVARGFEVNVVHKQTTQPPGRLEPVRRLVARLSKWKKANHLAPWVKIDPEVRLIAAPEIDDHSVPNSHAVVATAWQTAPWVAALDARKGSKFYFLQHYEICMGAQSEVDSTFRLPLRKLVIARWLADVVSTVIPGQECDYVPNAIDHDVFTIHQNIAKRPLRVGMLWHEAPWKGSEVGLQAIKALKVAFPKLEARLFGTGAPPPGLPSWVRYNVSPDVRQLVRLYNGCALFLQPSHTEGWGLTSTEAMACGCALVTVENGGSREFAFDQETALVVPNCDGILLRDALWRLVDDRALRERIAQRGENYVRQFTWERSTSAFQRAVFS